VLILVLPCVYGRQALRPAVVMAQSILPCHLSTGTAFRRDTPWTRSRSPCRLSCEPHSAGWDCRWVDTSAALAGSRCAPRTAHV